MTTDSPGQIRRRILKNYGVKPKRGGGLEPRTLNDTRQGLTTVMRLLEARYGKDIEDIISLEQGSIYEIAEYLEGAVAPSTIARWRKRLHINE